MDASNKLAIVSNAVKKSLYQFHETMCPFSVVEGAIVSGYDAALVEGHYQAIGVIAVSGDCTASVSVHLKKDFALKVAKNLLGLDDVSESDLYDTVGEVTNIVVGTAKTIASASLNFDISCPTVIKGNTAASAEPLKNSQINLLPFKVDGDDVMIMVCVLG